MASEMNSQAVVAVTLHNISPYVQSVIDARGAVGIAGQRYDLPPQHIQAMHPDLAGMFLDKCGRYVVRYVPSSIPVVQGEPTVWIANCTGNPFLPKTVYAKRMKKGEEIDVEVDNPNGKPRVIRETMKGGQRTVLGETGQDEAKESVNLCPIIFEFAPFTERPVSRSYASWLLRRDDMRDDGWRGSLREVGAPREYRPNETWDLPTLQSFVRCMEAKEILERPDLFGKTLNEYADNGDGITKMNEDRIRLAQSIWFVLLEEARFSPTRVEFAAWVKKFDPDLAEANRRKGAPTSTKQIESTGRPDSTVGA